MHTQFWSVRITVYADFDQVTIPIMQCSLTLLNHNPKPYHMIIPELLTR
jgi:hypothetical protein